MLAHTVAKIAARKCQTLGGLEAEGHNLGLSDGCFPIIPIGAKESRNILTLTEVLLQQTETFILFVSWQVSEECG